ncbi:MAG: hypothetical protein OEZ31_09040 [Nitrospirota bacterium]|nr:hypothetical protein [Nitrospirota bacterium]
MRMKLYALSFVGYAQHIQVLRESYYFAPEGRAAHQSKKPDAIVASAMSGISTI